MNKINLVRIMKNKYFWFSVNYNPMFITWPSDICVFKILDKFIDRFFVLFQLVVPWCEDWDQLKSISPTFNKAAFSQLFFRQEITHTRVARSKIIKRPNFAMSSFKKGQILKNEKRTIFFKKSLKQHDSGLEFHKTLQVLLISQI